MVQAEAREQQRQWATKQRIWRWWQIFGGNPAPATDPSAGLSSASGMFFCPLPYSIRLLGVREKQFITCFFKTYKKFLREQWVE